MTIQNQATLVSIPIGQKAKIIGFAASAKDFRQKLLAMGLTKGTVIKVTRVAPLGDPLEIEVRGYALSLRKSEAQIIMVESAYE